MHILAELDTQRKALLKKGEDVPSHMVEPSFEELMAGRVQPSPDETPKEKEKRISAFWFMVEFLPPKVRGAKGWEADMCSIPLQQTNFTASDETMTKLALENMWRQWDMFQDYVVRFSKKLVIFCYFVGGGGEVGTPTHLSNFVPRTVAWYGYTCNNVASIPMPYKKDKL
jgi:hypothetical protein